MSKLNILPVSDPSFRNYGQVLTGYDVKELLETLDRVTPCPDGVEYVPEQPELQALAIEKEFRLNAYGGMPVQVGWCNGHNTKLNCLEYHRDDEVDICSTDMILMLALQSELENYTLDTSKVKAFLVPAGTGVMLRSAALHYCPCHVGGDDKFFRMAVVLPKGTNTGMPRPEAKCTEDQLIWARNKWLIAHNDNQALLEKGAMPGIYGVNIEIRPIR